MTEKLINIGAEKKTNSIIKVLGVGGGGNNAVNYMYQQGIKDVDFAICNTDIQVLETSPIPVKLQIGVNLTEGLGAGNKPEKGKEAAMENIDDIINYLSNGTKMLFITTGMGGGTGTGAAPIIAKAAKELGILTVAIVTIPFKFEGDVRINQAIKGVEEIKKHVDSLLIIDNEKLREIYGNLQLSDAFSKADDVLATGAKSIAEIITVEGYINVDFEDVRTVMANSGAALMGSSTAEGDNRALDATKEALSSPLLNNNDVSGAKNILLNITSAKGDSEITMDEITEITNYVKEKAGQEAVSLIWGTGYNDMLKEKVCVTVIITGFQTDEIIYKDRNKSSQKQNIHVLDNKGYMKQSRVEIWDNDD